MHRRPTFPIPQCESRGPAENAQRALRSDAAGLLIHGPVGTLLPGVFVLMTFTQAVRSVLSKYATFSGRARRSEYWWFYLFTILVSVATSIVDAVLGAAFDNEIGIVSTIASLALLLPSLAVTARRLHDTGRTGWWMLFPVVAIFATVVVAFVTVFDALLVPTPTSPPQPRGSWCCWSAGCSRSPRASRCWCSCAWTPRPARTSTARRPSSRPWFRPGRAGHHPPVGYGVPPPSPGQAQPYGYPPQHQ